MAVSQTTRLLIYRWTEGTDPFTRGQMDTSHANLESRVGLFLSGNGLPTATIPAGASNARALYLNTATNALYYSDGSTWRLLGDPGTPSSITPGGSNSAGTAVTLARTDHVHALPDYGTPVSVQTANSAGVATTFARSDHVHSINTAAVGATQIATDAVTTIKILDANVTEAKIASSAVTESKIGTSAVTTTKIADLNVTTGKIADSNITTAKIADLNVTTGKLADLGVTTGKIAANAVTAAKIASATITATELASDSVTTAKIAALAVTTAKIAASAVTATELAADAVTTAKILDLNVTTGKLAANAVTTAKIASAAVTATELASNAVTTAKILDANVTEGKLASGSVTEAKIGSGAVTESKLATGAVTAGKIGTGAVTETKIADGAVTAAKLATGAAFQAGMTMPYAGLSAPTGWLFANGASVSRSTYADLFAAITSSKGTASISIASPCVVTLNGHGLVDGDAIYFTTTGSLPTGLSTNTTYYVKSPATNTFQLSATRSTTTGLAGTAINTSGTQSGTHTVVHAPYGVPDSGNFFLPDLRGRIPVAPDALGGTAASRLTFPNAVGFGAGTQTHTLTSSEMPVHTHTQNAHTHTQNAHTHTQTAHTHTQDAHTHTQDAHTHSQSNHTHGITDPGHYHGFPFGIEMWYNGGPNHVINDNYVSSGNYPHYFGVVGITASANTGITGTNGATANLSSTTATNQNTTATNQNTTAVNQSTTATNQNATAVNQNAGGDGAHNNMSPFVLMNYIIKT